MTKIDRRHIYGIMLDTETANTIEENSKPIMDYVLPYDFGFQVIDTYGRVYEAYSFINKDIFFDEAELMQSAYYARKIPQYMKDIANGKRIVSDTYSIKRKIADLCALYDCKFICAHNARFDVNACNNIERWMTKSRFRYFFPYGVEIWDTLKMARSVLSQMPTYKRFCEENGYITKNKQLRYTAEIIYQYITKSTDFQEEHTGLEDVQIETEILAYLKRQHKPMKKVLYEAQK